MPCLFSLSQLSFFKFQLILGCQGFFIYSDFKSDLRSDQQKSSDSKIQHQNGSEPRQRSKHSARAVGGKRSFFRLSAVPPGVGVRFSSGEGGGANGYISCRLLPQRRLGGREVIPLLLLPSSSGISHFITAQEEEERISSSSLVAAESSLQHTLSCHFSTYRYETWA